LEKSEVRVLKKVDLTNPVFVDLTSSLWSPVNAVGHMLVERTRAEKVGELYSPYFPDYVTSGDTGLCTLPKLEFYAAEGVSPNLLIFLGEQHADPNDVYAYYDVSEAALNYAIAKGCKIFASCAIFRSKRAEDRVYVAATTSQEATSLSEKLGDKPFPFGKIIGQMGPLLGLAKVQGYKVLSILGSIKGDQEDENMANILLDRLVKAIELTLV
jgi:proteasome assembly chaperone (PAC2) family protein